MLYEIVKGICEAKRGKVHPVLATELELKRELSRRGVPYTADTFRMVLREMERNPDIITHQLLRYNGYSIKGEEI